MGEPATVPAELGELRLSPTELRLQLLTGDGVLAATVALDLHTARALVHVLSLHAHDHGCRAAPQVHVDLLRRGIAALGGRATCVIVRPDPAPAFWLRVGTKAGRVELDLGVLDACCLLAARRLPLAVTQPLDGGPRPVADAG